MMGINSLPTEIAELITIHLDLPGFCTLRLLSKQVNQQIIRSFTERFFRQRTLKWTQSSFKELLDVADDPTFGHALRKLVIDATPYYGRRLWQMERVLRGYRDDPDWQEMREVTEEKREACWHSANKAAKFWKETDWDRKSLTSVFKKIKQESQGGRNEDRELESLLFKYESYGNGDYRKYHEKSLGEMSRPFISTMTAIAASGLRIRKIICHEKQYFGAVSIGRLESLAPNLKHFTHLFSRLQVLQLNLRDWRVPDEGFALPEQHVPFVVRFLAKAQNLTSLEISCYSTLDQNLFSAMARTCHYPHLVTCKLDFFRLADAVDLLTFLAPSKASLTHLELSHILLDNTSSSSPLELTWPELLFHLVSTTGLNLQLHYLRVSRLFVNRNVGLTFDATDCKWRSSVLELSGTISEDGKSDMEAKVEWACRTALPDFSPPLTWMVAASLAPRLVFEKFH